MNMQTHVIAAINPSIALSHYVGSFADDFDSDATVLQFSVDALILEHEDFINLVLNEEIGTGEFEVSTNKGRVMFINYIATDKEEMTERYIAKINRLINDLINTYQSRGAVAYFC